MATALEAVEPAAAVDRHLQRTGDWLTAGEKRYNLSRIKRILIVGAGKASEPMARAVVGILGDAFTSGIVIVKEGWHQADDTLPPGLRVLEASHPIPDERGVQATREVLSLLSGAGVDDLVICLLSGGASALLTQPVEGISLQDVQRMTDLLLRSGAGIQQINALRKHHDVVKGGGLARAANGAQVLSLILSDVVGDRLDAIASGPTAPDSSTFLECLQIIQHYQLENKIPPSILEHLQRGATGEIPETLKAGEPLLERVNNVLVGSNRQAAAAGQAAAMSFGLNTKVLTVSMQAEARNAGRILAGIARDVAAGAVPIPRPACLIAVGETTVTISGEGLGGRNQEAALAAVVGMSDLPDSLLVTLATDGNDGPTDAAGAVVSGDTLTRARALGLLPSEYLVRNDSYHFFAALGDLLKPGPTLTNVNDLAFLFLF
jgi:hydroxypyruvate reductase